MAGAAVNELWLLHGVNLDMLGARPAEHYGRLTLAELEARVSEHGERRGFVVRCFQTNHEGELVEKLHELALTPPAAIIINPGAWTHYSYALRDALELVAAPVAEVHLSAIELREEWRRRSVIADVATVSVSGKGVDGYLEAVDALAAAVADAGVSEKGAHRAAAAPDGEDAEKRAERASGDAAERASGDAGHQASEGGGDRVASDGLSSEEERRRDRLG